MMWLSAKSRCQGCYALKCIKDDKGEPMFTCLLGHVLTYLMNDGVAYAPKPDEKCFKPKTEAEFKEAKILITEHFKTKKRKRLNARTKNSYKNKRFKKGTN